MNIILSVDPIKFPLTGIGRYTYELAQGLAQDNRINELRFFQGTSFTGQLPQPGDQTRSRLQGVQRFLAKNRSVVTLHRYLTSIVKRRALNRCTDALFHGPNFYLPPFAGKAVATIHDLSIFTWSSCHPPERVRYMQSELELTLKRASFLLTDSEFTRQEVARFFSWPLSKIRAVHLASAEEFYPRPLLQLKQTLAMYDLSANGYALFVGTIEPRKNIETLLDAYAALPLHVRQKWPLILVGYQGWKSADLHTRIRMHEREGWLRYLGFVSRQDLPILYAGARLFVFPSHYEGFGLPVIEAMASGVPVVCTKTSSLPEVAGDAAAMCSPSESTIMRNLIAQGLEDEMWRATAVSRGRQQAATFSWARCARETIAAYQDALAL